ncbi:3-keto-5-aminohexanoate cleavage protein [Streptomyces sp. G-G2]|nr:3-keto-5-aminohexanoate cleavage protein [Streptomyces sp. G-G2]MDJ0381566.1 3-keto-5-aminohexanoate cleavage protein [Streptomyces sp. G-G2]
MLQVALNGARTGADGAAVPMSPQALVESARRSVAAGAGEVLVHPRTPCGRESLSPRVVGPLLEALRAGGAAGPLVVCASVDGGSGGGAGSGAGGGSGGEADPAGRVARVRAWEVLPDRAEVRFAEPGAAELARALAERGVAVDAVVSGHDVEAGGAGTRELRGFAGAARVVVELGAGQVLASAVSGWGGATEVLVHGCDAAAWDVLLRGAGTGPRRLVRIGLGDVLRLPEGRPARSNEELVAVARALLGQEATNWTRGA